MQSEDRRQLHVGGLLLRQTIHQELGVPIGLIKTAWGGTPVEAWSRLPVLEAEERAQEYLGDWQTKRESYETEKARATYEKQLARWREAVVKAKAAKRREPPKPRLAGSPATHSHHPATLYNGMIAPLLPYAIAGAIWYQGESNANRAYSYQKTFNNMITDWRRQWGQGDFPFGFVQLANYRESRNRPTTTGRSSARPRSWPCN